MKTPRRASTEFENAKKPPEPQSGEDEKDKLITSPHCSGSRAARLLTRQVARLQLLSANTCFKTWTPDSAAEQTEIVKHAESAPEALQEPEPQASQRHRDGEGEKVLSSASVQVYGSGHRVRDMEGEGSATEEWMVRLSEKRLHMPWVDKRFDYNHEVLTHLCILARPSIFVYAYQSWCLREGGRKGVIE